MMFIETSAKTRPVQIHVQRRHRSSSLSCESISKRFWLEPRISQGRQHRCSCNMHQHKFFGSHTDENTRFMLARRALVSAMATASWQKTSGVDGCLETEAVHVRVSSFYDFLLWTSRRALPLLTVSVQKNQVLAFLAKPPAICHPRVFPAVRRFGGSEGSEGSWAEGGADFLALRAHAGASQESLWKGPQSSWYATDSPPGTLQPNDSTFGRCSARCPPQLSSDSPCTKSSYPISEPR